MRFSIGLAAATLALLLLRPGDGAAQAPADETDSASSRASAGTGYRALVEEAIEEYRLGNWAEASALFARAHALQPNARTLRGLGMTAYSGRSYVEAIDYLQQALVHPRKPLDATQRREAEDLLDKARRYVAHVELELMPASAALRVDGHETKLGADGGLRLNPGEYELVASAEGYLEQRRRIRVAPGGQLSLVIELERRARPVEQPAAALAPVASTLAPEPAAAQPDQVGDDGGRLWTWVALGGAAVFAGTAVALYLAGQGELDDIEQQCPPGACTLMFIDRRIDQAQLETYELLTNVSWALSGASLVAASVLFFTEGDGESHEPEGLSLGPTGAHLRMRF